MKSFFIALLLGFSVFASAQNKITGTIKEVQNKPLAGVTIFLPEIHKETISDEKGNYVISNLPSGNFKIVFSFIGYATQSKAIELNQQKPDML